MAGINESPFLSVLSTFRSRLMPKHIEAFQFTTFEELKKAITEIQKIQAQRRCFRNLNKVRPFLNGLEQYSRVIEVFVNAKPIIMAFVWGPIKFCLQVASNLTEAFDALLDAYEKLGKSLPIFSAIDQLFLSHGYVQQVLVDVYEDVLDFHKRAVLFFSQSMWKISFKVGIHTFGDMFGDVIKKLERSRELLLNSAHIAHFQESQEARLLFTKAFDAELERTKKDRMLTITDWLSPTSCYADHEEQQRKRHGFPRTTRWMFSESSMCRWLQQGGSSNCSFWIRGIPGAGKTVLFSSIVDYVKETIPESQVIFFYCKNGDHLKKTLDGVARSLIAQLLQLNPISLDFLYETAVSSGERHPSTFKTYQNILEHLLVAHDFLFIGIDGLDECEKEDRRLILSLLDKVLKVSSQHANVKMFLTSQKIKDMEDLLAPAIRFDIGRRHFTHDIHDYVSTRSLRLCQTFGLCPEKQKSIITDVSSRSDGMFLLARLIMDNLIDQESLEDLEEELDTDILPKGINEAYGRILIRLSKGRSKKSQERTIYILGLIITARRPLKFQEVQGALSIRLQDRSVDFARRRLLTPLSELCGSIVEVHADNTISFVHPTARQYLIQYHSGPFINILTSETRMARLCVEYLTFECFQSLDIMDNEDLVATGAYAFQEYATLNWIYHSELALNLSLEADDQDLSSLRRWCSNLLSYHRESSHQSRASSGGEMQPGNCDLRQELSQIHIVYNSVYSIQNSGESDYPLPYSMQHLSQVRSEIEKMNLNGRSAATMLTEAYGSKVFKCSIPSCSNFLDGFKSLQARNKHQSTHNKGVFECTYSGCDYSTIGFPTRSGLAKHLLEHEPLADELTFPKVQRCSLSRALELAVDIDDIVAVSALCAEAEASLLVESNILGRAIKKKSCEATKLLLQSLSSEDNLHYLKSHAGAAMNLAAGKGDEELTKVLITMSIDIIPSTNAVSPIYVAAERGHARILKLLLDEGNRYFNLSPFQESSSSKALLPAQELSPSQISALFIGAARGGHEEVLSLLLQTYGAAYADSNNYYKGIKAAASYGHESSVRLLLEKGCELGAKKDYPKNLHSLGDDTKSMLPIVMKHYDQALQLAASKGNIGEVLKLLGKGFNINYSSETYGTALQVASLGGKSAMVQQLLDRGADVNAIDKHCMTAIEQAASKGHTAVVSLLLESMKIPHANKNSALSHGAAGGHKRVVELLLEWKADINTYSAAFGTALKEAAKFRQEAMIEFLLERGANINGYTGGYGTALQEAAKYGHQAIVVQLIERGAEVDAVEDMNVETALCHAVRAGHESTVKKLLEGKADVNAASESEHAPLQIAADRGFEAIVKLLLEGGADIDSTSRSGLGTALAYAARNGCESVVRLLTEWKADVNAASETEVAPLQTAASHGHEVVVRLLLEHGAEVNQRSRRSTALEEAAVFGYTSISQLLLDWKADPQAALIRVKREGNGGMLAYQIQLMLLEQQNKKRLLSPRGSD